MLRVLHCEKFYIMQSSLTTIDLADMSEQNGPTILTQSVQWAYINHLSKCMLLTLVRH